jgi:hypothetical protein
MRRLPNARQRIPDRFCKLERAERLYPSLCPQRRRAKPRARANRRPRTRRRRRLVTCRCQRQRAIGVARAKAKKISQPGRRKALRNLRLRPRIIRLVPSRPLRQIRLPRAERPRQRSTQVKFSSLRRPRVLIEGKSLPEPKALGEGEGAERAWRTARERRLPRYWQRMLKLQLESPARVGVEVEAKVHPAKVPTTPMYHPCSQNSSLEPTPQTLAMHASTDRRRSARSVSNILRF